MTVPPRQVPASSRKHGRSWRPSPVGCWMSAAIHCCGFTQFTVSIKSIAVSACSNAAYGEAVLRSGGHGIRLGHFLELSAPARLTAYLLNWQRLAVIGLILVVSGRLACFGISFSTFSAQFSDLLSAANVLHSAATSPVVFALARRRRRRPAADHSVETGTRARWSHCTRATISSPTTLTATSSELSR